MKLSDYMEFGGIEIANENRSADYLNAGLLTGVSVVSANCSCAATDDGPYTSPAADPAPWYDATRSESGEFLGLLATETRLDAVGIRSVTPRSSAGSTIGRLYLRHRILSCRGVLMASTAQGMAYGERWLADVLAGRIQGCAPDSVRVLLACPQGSAVAQFRTLRRIGIVDGPTPGPAQELPECFVQEVQFQLASGLPWLYGDEQTCLAGLGS